MKVGQNAEFGTPQPRFLPMLGWTIESQAGWIACPARWDGLTAWSIAQGWKHTLSFTVGCMLSGGMFVAVGLSLRSVVSF